MESQSTQPPLKVCRHCSVASRTDAATCPSCGRAYQRRIWRWWLVIPIVLLAFTVGFFGRKALQDEAGDSVKAQQASEVELGISQAELADELAQAEPRHTSSGATEAGELTCLYYALEGVEDTDWEFCFTDDVLTTSTEVTGAERPGG